MEREDGQLCRRGTLFHLDLWRRDAKTSEQESPSVASLSGRGRSAGINQGGRSRLDDNSINSPVVPWEIRSDGEFLRWEHV